MVTAQHHSSANQNDWLLRWKQNSKAKARLICFPFASGGAYYYKPWAEILPPEIEICAVQLPGRENRLRERQITKMDEALRILAPLIEPLLDIPFAFFGHSMGAIIAFELCRELRRHNKTQPDHLFVSATNAPQLRRDREALHTMSDNELLQEVTRYGGTPLAVLQDKDMMAMMLSLLRADCTLFETCEYVAEAPLAYPITVFGSAEDSRTTDEGLTNWKEQTSSSFSVQTFPGGHFFLKDIETRNSMLKTIAATILLNTPLAG